MSTHADVLKDNGHQSLSTQRPQRQIGDISTFQFIDNRSEIARQRKLQEMVNNSPNTAPLQAIQGMLENSPRIKHVAQLQAAAGNSSSQQVQPIQQNENNTGLPGGLKTGMENLSGISLNDVQVHRNSDKPALLQAHAYTQGSQIFLGPGQEKHLPHEAWHVIQQKQGRVKPTMQTKGVSINNDLELEREADVMGEKAAALQTCSTESSVQRKGLKLNSSYPVRQFKPLTANQAEQLPELTEEVELLCDNFTEDKEEIERAVGSPYDEALAADDGGRLGDNLESWLPKFETFFGKLAIIPDRATGSRASFGRLKRQLSLWNDALKDEYYAHVEQFWDIYHARKEADTDSIGDERDELVQITEADERYFRWYLSKGKPPLSVYRGDGRGVDEHSLDHFQFDHVRPGGKRDISFRGVVEHTHTNTRKNGMVSTTSDFDGAHFWATSQHKFGIVFEMRPVNYINVTDLLRARNFKERYPGQFEILVPGAVSADEVVSATLYNKQKVVKRIDNG